MRNNYILYLFFLFSFSHILGQESKVVVSINNNSGFLFRNYSNTIDVGFQGVCDEGEDLKVICDECDSIEPISKYKYYIYINSSRSVDLKFYLIGKENNFDSFIGKKKVRVASLPDPEVIFGNYISEEIVVLDNIRFKQFFAYYPPLFTIEAVFNVIEWKVSINDKVFTGKGSKFSNELNQFLFGNKITKETKIEVLLTIESPDCTTRNISENFRVISTKGDG